jgi:hypothetical protein
MLEQNAQLFSRGLVITSLLNNASLVGNLSSNNLQPKMLTFDETLFNQRCFKACTVPELIVGITRLYSRAIYVDLTVKKPAA